MRCRNCGYRLWNLKSRQCPECGTPFQPSDYDFVPNAVHFACPHCDQRYYGTGDRGHLVPIEFECPGCHQHVHMDEMVVLPTPGVDEEQTAPPVADWLERSKRGFFRSWLATIAGALVKPGRLIQSVPTESSLPEAWWFLFLMTLLAVGCTVGSWMILPLVIGQPGAGLGLAFGILGVVVLAGTMVFVGVWTGVTHGILCLLAAPAAGPRRTSQALCYSSGANALGLIPILGIYIGPIWWLASAVVMVKQGQQVSGLRAAIAVLFTPFLVLCAIVAFYAWVILFLLPQNIAAANPTRTPLMRETQAVEDALLLYTHEQGRAPEHAVQLVAQSCLTVDDLISDNHNTASANLPFANTQLGQLEDLLVRRQSAVVDAAVASLPAGTVAHRLGDFVFTYHGIDLAGAPDARLWVVVQSLDPDLNNPQWAGGYVRVGLAGGTVVPIPASSLQASLRKQNTIRARCNLPPLPDPTSVTHDRPAVTGG